MLYYVAVVAISAQCHAMRKRWCAAEDSAKPPNGLTQLQKYYRTHLAFEKARVKRLAVKVCAADASADASACVVC